MDRDRAREELKLALGAACTWDHATRLTYRHDLWPRTQIKKRFALPTAEEPLAVVHARDEADIETTVRIARRHGVAVIPYGGGSGVMGGIIPLGPAIALDLKRMARLLDIDPVSMIARVEAGKLGEELETELRARGYTLGHYPSSIHCSTVGGYAATRSAGQFSNRYGKFEDMVEGLRVFVPAKGRGFIELDRAADEAAGTGFVDALLGSEGTLGVITRVDLRVHPKPLDEAYRGAAFPSVESGWAAMRGILQAGLRPSVLRLYDPFDSIVALKHGAPKEGATGGSILENVASGAVSLEALLAPVRDLADGVGGEVQRRGLRQLLRRPGVTNRLIGRALRRVAMIIGFEGATGNAAGDMERALEIIASHRGQDHGEEPGLAWLRRRHSVSFKQAPVFHAGGFVDTFEVATSWRRLPGLYAAVRKAVSNEAFIMAHFSHAYPDGCSIYFTFAGLRDGPTDALAQYDRIWRAAVGAATASDATLSHHHGVGLLKGAFLDKEVCHGRPLYQRYKQLFDPEGLMNPGKLWEVDP